jgi:MoxR-like ATPase
MTYQHFERGEPRELPVIPINSELNDPRLYRPSDGLVHAVNVAINLNQPLLLTGEPGTGKTQLAYHLAWFFQMGDPIVFSAQTTSTAKDLFYRYDALGHFQYTQTHKDKVLSDEEVEKRFISYEDRLGQAIVEDKRYVVLIDEIDKAPRDLPNDILGAIEKLEFRVTEINKVYKAHPENRPLIILTSNSEKNLPDAFLRRVVYYHIPFPSEKDLMEILKLKTQQFKNLELGPIVKHFLEIREEKLKTKRGRAIKLKNPPATSALIYWTLLLHKMEFDTSLLSKVGEEELPEIQKNKLRQSYSVLAKNKDDLQTLQQMI